MPETRHGPEQRAGLLRRNTLWNLVGQGTPLVAALFAVPLLVTKLGTDRFGVLTLAWALVGYLSLFDLGIGRAMTKLVAERLGVGHEAEIPAVAWTGLSIMVLLGLATGFALGLLSPQLVERTLKIPRALRVETLHALYILALSIPAVISTAGLRGILEAYQRFDLVNLVRIPMGAFTFLAPVLVLPFSHNLAVVVAALVALRLVTLLLHLLLCLRVMPSLRKRMALEPKVIRPLIRLGSWMTVSNIVGPVMLYLDRFLIGALISVAAVAYYATPYEMVTKLLVIPGAVVGVLFPAFAASFAPDPSRTADLFRRGLKYLFLALFPITLLIVILAPEGLTIWLGSEFAEKSARVLQWLAVGVLLNSLAQVPFAVLQGVGRPDLTAKVHLVELPLYVLVAWWLIGSRGIEGAAIAWLIRATVDAFVLFWLSLRLLPTSSRFAQRLGSVLAPSLVALAVATLPTSIAMKGLFLLITLATFIPITWFQVLSAEERELVQRTLRTPRH